MNVENQSLVTREPVEFDKQPGQNQDFGKITDPFIGFYIIFLNLTKKIWKMPTCNQLVFENTS